MFTSRRRPCEGRGPTRLASARGTPPCVGCLRRDAHPRAMGPGGGSGRLSREVASLADGLVGPMGTLSSPGPSGLVFSPTPIFLSPMGSPDESSRAPGRCSPASDCRVPGCVEQTVRGCRLAVTPATPAVRPRGLPRRSPTWSSGPRGPVATPRAEAPDVRPSVSPRYGADPLESRGASSGRLLSSGLQPARVVRASARARRGLPPLHASLLRHGDAHLARVLETLLRAAGRDAGVSPADQEAPGARRPAQWYCAFKALRVPFTTWSPAPDGGAAIGA